MELSPSNFHLDVFWQQNRLLPDPIYDSFQLPVKLFDIVDTPEFQRLRQIKQTGTCSWVFPSAVHTRFSHCLGTAHLADLCMREFRHKQPELEITELMHESVTVAALVHDLGHGPFSHVFEHWMHNIGHKSWDHESMGAKLFENIIDGQALDFDAEQVKHIQNLVLGEDNSWLGQIVANHKNGLDVDKFDYIRRDAYYLGLGQSFAASKLMNYSRVIGNNICYLDSCAWDVSELFETRFSLHKRNYQHSVVKALDLMMYDIFYHSDSTLNISERACDLEQYQYLTDQILNEIQINKDPALKTAKHILDRIHRRDLYIVVAEFHCHQKNDITAQEIFNHTNKSSFKTEKESLKVEDIVVQVGKINFGMGPVNTIKHVDFYSKYDVDKSFQLDQSQFGHIRWDRIEELTTRVFLKKVQFKDAVTKAVAICLKKRNLPKL